MHYFQNYIFNLKPEKEDLRAEANFVGSSGRKLSFFITCKKAYGKLEKSDLAKLPPDLFFFPLSYKGSLSLSWFVQSPINEQ